MKTKLAPVALITGSARRIGAAIAHRLHEHGYNLALHYRNSKDEMTSLLKQLNTIRADSCIGIHADLLIPEELSKLVPETVNKFGRLDVLINNASAYYATPFGTITDVQWDELFSSNVRAPFFLSQAAFQHLTKTHGAIINIADIFGERPLRGYSPYSITKSALLMLTKSLAVEMGPRVRVNAVAPGNILWSERKQKAETLSTVIERTALRRQGTPNDVADTVCGLLTGSPYITGQIISVDGGRNLFI